MELCIAFFLEFIVLMQGLCCFHVLQMQARSRGFDRPGAQGFDLLGVTIHDTPGTHKLGRR